MASLSERGILGSILKNNYLLKETSLQPEQFEDRTNQTIFRAMLELEAKGRAIDFITLLSLNSPEDMGGANYVSDLRNYANAAKFDDYVDSVMELWKGREKNRILQQALAENWDVEEVAASLASLNRTKMSDYKPINQLLAEVYEAPFVNKPLQKGVPTGLDGLQRITNGWQKNDLIIVAARPSMGKTDFMLKSSIEAGWAGYLPIIFSLEMSGELLRDRLIAAVGRYNRSQMKDPFNRLEDRQKESWSQVIGETARTNVQIFDAAGQTVAQMRAKAREAMSNFPDLEPIIYIDYLTLIRPSRNLGNKHLEVGDVTKDLKGMAKEFNCPVMSLAQLSRKVEERADKRPYMSDLRESGSIEEDADIVCFLYRDAYYSDDENDKILEMIFAKQRNGPIGTVEAAYISETGQIVDIAQ